MKHGTPITTETVSPRIIACTAATAASAGSFSPMRRATMAVVDRLNPIATANTRLSIDSVRPIVATESGPSRATQNTSTTANSDSRTISKTIGTASRKMARFRLPAVKSWCEPRSASRSELHNAGCDWVVAVEEVFKTTFSLSRNRTNQANAADL
jgi:hypothetical protein